VTAVPALLVLAHDVPHAGGASPQAWALPLLTVAGLATVYVAGVVRLGRNGRSWSRGRTAGFGLGLVLVGAALSPPMDTAAVGAAGHMIQHLLLSMVAPIGLVLGAPLTLLLGALPAPARRPVAAVLRSSLLHVTCHPVTAAVLSVGALYVLYLTPLYALSTRSELVHHLLHVHFLLAGYLFAWAVAGPDPAPRRPRLGVRTAAVVAAGAAHGCLAKLLYSRAPALPPGSGHGATELEQAAQWMYYGGHLADLLLLTALFATWYRRTGRSLSAIAARST
jgi:putative membrane protein